MCIFKNKKNYSCIFLSTYEVADQFLPQDKITQFVVCNCIFTYFSMEFYKSDAGMCYSLCGDMEKRHNRACMCRAKDAIQMVNSTKYSKKQTKIIFSYRSCSSHSVNRNSALNLTLWIKVSVSQDLWPPFFHYLNPSRLLINRLKYFGIRFQFSQDIRSQSSKNATPGCAWHREVKTLGLSSKFLF